MECIGVGFLLHCYVIFPRYKRAGFIQPLECVSILRYLNARKVTEFQFKIYFDRKTFLKLLLVQFSCSSVVRCPKDCEREFCEIRRLVMLSLSSHFLRSEFVSTN